MSIISILELAGVAHLQKSRQLIESLILVEGYKEAQVEFGSVAGEQQAETTIDQFRDLVNRNQVQGNERNIDYWRKQGWDQFSAFVREKAQQKSKREEKKDEGQSVVIEENDEWLIVVPIDKAASCFHGRNTDWCTTKPHQPWFERYFYRDNITLVYFLKLNSGDKWAMAVNERTEAVELFDRQDNKITKQQFQQQTELDPMLYRNRVIQTDEVRTRAAEARVTYKQAYDRVIDALEDGVYDRNPQLEQDLLLLKDVNLIVSYCRSIGERWPKAEPLIAKDAHHAALYAIDVIKKRWPEGEKEIMRYSSSMRDYMDEFIDGRWPEAERFMLDNKRALSALRYAISTVHDRWPEAERMVIERGNDLIRQIEQANADGDGPKIDELDDQLEMLRSAMDDYADEMMPSGRWPEAKTIYDYQVPT